MKQGHESQLPGDGEFTELSEQLNGIVINYLMSLVGGILLGVDRFVDVVSCPFSCSFSALLVIHDPLFAV